MMIPRRRAQIPIWLLPPFLPHCRLLCTPASHTGVTSWASICSSPDQTVPPPHSLLVASPRQSLCHATLKWHGTSLCSLTHSSILYDLASQLKTRPLARLPIALCAVLYASPTAFCVSLSSQRPSPHFLAHIFTEIGYGPFLAKGSADSATPFDALRKRPTNSNQLLLKKKREKITPNCLYLVACFPFHQAINPQKYVSITAGTAVARPYLNHCQHGPDLL